MGLITMLRADVENAADDLDTQPVQQVLRQLTNVRLTHRFSGGSSKGTWADGRTIERSSS